MFVTSDQNDPFTGNVLVAIIKVTGLVPKQEHFQHVHGDSNATATCPSAADANRSNVITVTEALAKIGSIAFDLQPYPVADAHGTVDITQTFTLDPDELARITPMAGLVMVFHGAMNQGKYDRSLLAACGPIQAA